MRNKNLEKVYMTLLAYKNLEKVYKNLLACLFVLIYVIPASVQLPFRVLILLLFNYFVFKYAKNKFLYVILCFVGVFYCFYKLEKGTFDTSILMVLLSIGPVYNFDVVCGHLKIDKVFIRNICLMAIFAAGIQLFFYDYNGRPNMSYEINQSASYLFLLFLYCDLANFKLGRILTICVALPLLSRLCFLAIVLFYIVRFLKNRFVVKKDIYFPYTLIIIGFAVAVSVFSYWYSSAMIDRADDVSDDQSRLNKINDQSNLLRFMINTRVLTGVYEGDEKIIYEGYGDLAQNKGYRAIYSFQPHNELLKHITQYGLFFTLFLLFVSSKYYKKVCTYRTIEYVFPIIIYTQLLWVRFTIVPSIEMIFIFYLLTYKNSLKNT